MGLRTLDPVKYGALCADAIPKVIENDKELDRLSEKLEELTFKKNSTREEKELAKLLEKLVQDYDDARYPIPPPPPHEMVQYLMEQRGLQQKDLVPLIGSRAQVSELVNGKRGISKAQAKRLAEFFHTSVELFI